MATAAASSQSRLASCAHCGLPVTATGSASSHAVLQQTGSAGACPLYCCRACSLAALILGKQEQGTHSANLLRLGLGALLAMNIMMISLLLYTGSIGGENVPLFRLILFALALPALAVLIPPFLAGAWQEIRDRRMSLDVLIAAGSLSAFTVSAVNTLRGTGEIYFDTATMLPVLVTVGKLIEASAKTRASDLLHGLQMLLPKTALRVGERSAEEVAVHLLRPGDLVRVRPGERLAADGIIVEGSSTIEEASFTGEFLPRHCRPGDAVIAGTVNGPASLLIRAERTGEELLLHRMVEMIQDAWRNPSKYQRLAERTASVFFAVVIATAAGALAVWSLLGNPQQGLLSALSVFVVACPCTMGIATPLATSLAIARAAKAGILVREGKVIEQLAETELMFFDKTGTITTGQPVVQQMVTIAPDTSLAELIGRLGALEEVSEHPLREAVMAQAAELGIDAGAAYEVKVVPGSGLAGEVKWRGVVKHVTAGTPSFVAGERDYPAIEDDSTVVDVAWDGELKGRLLISDSIREDALRCVRDLSATGINCLLLSGDRFSAASAVARQVGIQEVYAPRTPAQKLATVSAAVAAGRKVAMVGDGINDAAALAAAPTGIALEGGMELAKQAGNVVILSASLTRIPWLISLSRKAGGIMRGNFCWSFGYNAIALAAAAAGLLHPLLAAVLMVFSSVTVLGNSLRIAAFPEPRPAELIPPSEAPAHAADQPETQALRASPHASLRGTEE